MKHLELLLEQLLERWAQAFNQIDDLSLHEAQIKTVRYADGYRYELESFTPADFPSRGDMLTDLDNLNPDDLYKYGFNADGRPCFVTFGHVYNGITWKGYYSYDDTVVEYVEYCINTGIPSRIVRLNYEDGKKISSQSLIINGGGSMHLSTPHSHNELIESIKNDENTLIYTVTSFQYSPAGSIEKSTSLNSMSGIGKYVTQDQYSYDEHENLDTIPTFWSESESRLTYCRIPENLTATSLVESVASAMANSIAETLSKNEIEQPVAMLELAYHYADSYIPLLAHKSARLLDEQQEELLSIFMHDYYNAPLAEIPFERQFAQLEQMIKIAADAGIGRTMLCKAARLLTENKLFGKVMTTTDFAAYAIDWSIEGHSYEDFEHILLECGLTPALIEIWKEKGFFTRYQRQH